MGFLKDVQKRYRDAKEKQDKKSWYICNDCGGTMKPIIVQLGGSFREARVKCDTCGQILSMKDAKDTLEQPK